MPVPTHEMETEKAPPLQVVVVGFVVRLALAIETVAPVSHVPVAVLVVVMIWALAAGVVIVGAEGIVVSTVNEVTARILLALLAASVTVMVQFEYVPSARAVNVIVFAQTVADVVALLQEPPYVMVPASSVVKV